MQVRNAGAHLDHRKSQARRILEGMRCASGMPGAAALQTLFTAQGWAQAGAAECFVNASAAFSGLE